MFCPGWGAQGWRAPGQLGWAASSAWCGGASAACWHAPPEKFSLLLVAPAYCPPSRESLTSTKVNLHGMKGIRVSRFQPR